MFPFSDNLSYLFAFTVELECSKLLTRIRPQIFHIKQSKIFFLSTRGRFPSEIHTVVFFLNVNQ